MSDTCAMSYPASCIIARELPELATQVRRLDGLLGELEEGALLRLESTADHLGVDPATVSRLLGLYAEQGAVQRAVLAVCPEDGQILEPNAEGTLWCDVCERTYEAEGYETEIAYRLGPGLRPAPAGGDGVGDEPGLAAVRDLLRSAFTAAELRGLFVHAAEPALGEIRDQFGDGDELAVLVYKAVHYAHQAGLLADLLREVEMARPREYEAWRREGLVHRRDAEGAEKTVESE